MKRRRAISAPSMQHGVGEAGMNFPSSYEKSRSMRRRGSVGSLDTGHAHVH
jgi:hypothetical protein